MIFFFSCWNYIQISDIVKLQLQFTYIVIFIIFPLLYFLYILSWVDSHARATTRKIYQFVPVSIYPSFLCLMQAIIKSFTLETPLEVNQIKTTSICPLPLT